MTNFWHAGDAGHKRNGRPGQRWQTAGRDGAVCASHSSAALTAAAAAAERCVLAFSHALEESVMHWIAA